MRNRGDKRWLKAHVLLVLVAFVWGATFVQVKAALADISPLLFNAVRMTLAATVLVAVYFRHLKQATPASWRAGALAGTFLSLGYQLQTPGLALTTPAKSAFLTGMAVVLVPLFLVLFWGKKINRWTAVGVLAAFLGLYLLTVPSLPGSKGLGDFRSVNLGDLLTMACAVAFAFQAIFLGRATQSHPFEQIAVVQTTVAAVLMLATFSTLEHPHAVWSARVAWAVLVTALLGTAAAFTIQSWAQQFIPPTNTMLIFALEPVFAWVTSYVVLGERLGARAALGAALILGGLLASEMLGAVSVERPAAAAN